MNAVRCSGEASSVRFAPARHVARTFVCADLKEASVHRILLEEAPFLRRFSWSRDRDFNDSPFPSLSLRGRRSTWQDRNGQLAMVPVIEFFPNDPQVG